MQIDGTNVAIRYRGSRDIPAAAVVVLRTRLTQLARSISGPYQQSFQMQIDDRLVECRLWVDHLNGHKIDLDDRTCADLDGFLLWRKNITGVNHWYGAFTDGTSEEIKPLAEQTGNERLAGYEIPSEIQESPHNIPPVSSSLYSGQMREVVQCYYLSSEFNPFDYRWYRTHGVLENPARDPLLPERGDYFIVEISDRGVFAVPVTGGDRCCDSWDVTDYLAGEGESEAYKQTLSLAWNALDRANPPLVYTLLTQAQISTVYQLGVPFSPLAGWAFSKSGALAQNVVQYEHFNGFDFGTSAVNRYDCSRVKLTFTVTEDVPSAAISIIEKNVPCTLHRPSNPFWVPSATETGTYDGIYIHLNEIGSQDAPLHVWYNGEAECVLRFAKSITNVASQSFGSPANVNSDYFACDGPYNLFRCPGGPLNPPDVYTIPRLYTFETIGAYQMQQSGYYLTGPNPIDYRAISKSGHTRTYGSSTFTEDVPNIGSPAPNFAALIPGVDPNCEPCLCPCSGTHIQQTNLYSTRVDTLNETRSNGSISCSAAAILPQFEREGAVLLKSEIDRYDFYRRDGHFHFFSHFIEFFNLSCTPSSPTGICCLYDSYARPNCTPAGGGAGKPTTVDTPAHPTGTFEGQAVMRGKVFAEANLPMNNADPGGSYGQAMFWNKDDHFTITLGLTVIGGGLYYEEEDDEFALNRMTGFVFEAEPGEFVYDGQPITFVGRL